MKIVILTSSRYGTAAHHLPHIIQSKSCTISMVILNEGVISNRRKHIRQKIKKIAQIGILGALNGIRMRKWYGDDVCNKLEIREIESICQENVIPFYITPSINSEETVDLFKRADADLGISLGNGYISSRVFTIPRNGMINIHHEILPDYQNAQSVIWQIYNMSKNTGLTIHKIDKKIDTGAILFQKNMPIMFGQTLRQTVAHTYASLLNESAVCLVHVIRNFDQLFDKAKPQGKGQVYTTPSIWSYLKILLNFRKLRRS